MADDEEPDFTAKEKAALKEVADIHMARVINRKMMKELAAYVAGAGVILYAFRDAVVALVKGAQ